ncbi:MAG: hypothetical protein WCT27_02590, partial [Patescibacteria group bacterium]
MYLHLWLKFKLFITRQSLAVRWTSVGLVGIVVCVGLFGVVHPVHAWDLFGWAWDNVIETISTLLLGIATMIGKLVVVLIDILIGVVQYNDFVRSDAVSRGWVVVRDLCNMFFVAVLLIIAFGTILRIESYKYQRLLPQLIIMAVLINFSKLISGFLIDVSQVVLLTFVNAFKDTAAGNFVSVFQLKSMLGFVDLNDVDAATQLTDWQKVGLPLFAIILLTITLFVMLAMIVVFIARIVYLWVLIVLSPLAYLLAVVPMGKQYASRWWSTFGKWVTTGPVLAFFIWLALSILTTSSGDPAKVINLSGDQGNLVNGGITNAGLSAGLGTVSSSDNLLGFIISIALLVMSMGFAQALGGFAGKFAGNMMGKLQKLGSGALKVAGLPLAGLGALAKSQGRRARRWYEDKTPAIMQPWNLAKGAKERGEELDKMSRTAAQAKGREAWEKFTTGGKIKLPHVDKVESGFESQFARDYAIMDKEEKAETFRLLWQRNKKKPGDMETKRRMRGLLRVAAEGGHLDDIMSDEYFADEAEWEDEEGNKRKGFRDPESKEVYTRPMLNRFLKASVGNDQQGMRLVAEIEDIGKKAKHEEYGGHVQYDSKKGKYEWKDANDIGRAVSESSKTSARTGMGNAPHEFVGLREQVALVGDKDGLILNNGNAILGGKSTKLSKESYEAQKDRIDAIVKSGLAKLGPQNEDGTYDFEDLGPALRTSGGNMDAFNDAQFINKFGDQPTTRINEHAQIRTAQYMLGGGRQNIDENGAMVGDEQDQERIKHMMEQWIMAPIAFWKKIGAEGILKFQQMDMTTGQKVGNKKDIFDLIKEDAVKKGDATKGADGQYVYGTKTQDHLKEAYNFYKDPKNGALPSEENERLAEIAGEFGWKEEGAKSGKKEKERKEPDEDDEDEEAGSPLADVDQAQYDATKAKIAEYHQQGMGAFFASAEYQQGAATGQYLEQERYDEAQRLEEYRAPIARSQFDATKARVDEMGEDFFESDEYMNAKKDQYLKRDRYHLAQRLEADRQTRGAAAEDTILPSEAEQRLRGVATYGAKGSHNVLGLDFKNLDVEGVDLKNKAGEYITDPEVLKLIKPKLLEMIEAELKPLQAKSPLDLNNGEQQRMRALLSAKEKINDKESFNKLKLANIGRTGFDIRHVLSHENTHEQLDGIDPDGKLQKELWSSMSAQARQIATAQVKAKMNNQNMSEAQVMSEYFTEGLANAGPANRADSSPTAIKLAPAALQRLAEKVKASSPKSQVNAPLEENIVVPQTLTGRDRRQAAKKAKQDVKVQGQQILQEQKMKDELKESEKELLAAQQIARQKSTVFEGAQKVRKDTETSQVAKRRAISERARRLQQQALNEKALMDQASAKGDKATAKQHQQNYNALVPGLNAAATELEDLDREMAAVKRAEEVAKQGVRVAAEQVKAQTAKIKEKSDTLASFSTGTIDASFANEKAQSDIARLSGVQRTGGPTVSGPLQRGFYTTAGGQKPGSPAIINGSSAAKINNALRQNDYQTA